MSEDINAYTRECSLLGSKLVKGYSTKIANWPRVTMRKGESALDGDLLLGIELEVNYPRQARIENCLARLHKASKELYARLPFILKNDGSLTWGQGGIEFNFAPGQPKVIREELPKLLKILKSNSFTAWRGGCAGLHVHVPKDYFYSSGRRWSWRRLREYPAGGRFVSSYSESNDRLTQLVCHSEGQFRHSARVAAVYLLCHALGRDWWLTHGGKTEGGLDRYARCVTRENYAFGGIVSAGRLYRSFYNGDRYDVLNVRPEMTLEFRGFRSSLSANRFLLHVEIVTAICRWAKEESATRLLRGMRAAMGVSRVRSMGRWGTILNPSGDKGDSLKALFGEWLKRHRQEFGRFFKVWEKSFSGLKAAPVVVAASAVAPAPAADTAIDAMVLAAHEIWLSRRNVPGEPNEAAYASMNEAELEIERLRAWRHGNGCSEHCDLRTHGCNYAQRWRARVAELAAADITEAEIEAAEVRRLQHGYDEHIRSIDSMTRRQLEIERRRAVAYGTSAAFTRAGYDLRSGDGTNALRWRWRLRDLDAMDTAAAAAQGAVLEELSF